MEAVALANSLIEYLAPHCLRIEAAGSIRRMKPEIGDIELVAIPRIELDMFGSPLADHSLDLFNWLYIGRCIKSGHKYKQIELKEGINLDLFIVTPPAQWGVIFTIRTGPAEFSHRLVTQKSQGGLLPSNLRVEGGAIWNGKEIIKTPEEADLFRLAEMRFVEPWNRQ